MSINLKSACLDLSRKINYVGGLVEQIVLERDNPTFSIDTASLIDSELTLVEVSWDSIKEELRIASKNGIPVCDRCGSTLVKSPVEGYDYFCPVHYEDLYVCEAVNVPEGPPDTKRRSAANTKRVQEALLCLAKELSRTHDESREEMLEWMQVYLEQLEVVIGGMPSGSLKSLALPILVAAMSTGSNKEQEAADYA